MIANHLIKILIITLPLLTAAGGYAYKSITMPKPPYIMGHVENVLIGENKLAFKARLDTGAKTASLSAHDIQTFKKNGKTWVRFIIDTTRTQEIHQFEYPLKRRIKIRKRQAELVEVNGEIDPFEHRLVVQMPVCLGAETKAIEVSLTDRKDFNYPVLLGRKAMEAFNIVIDPGESFMHKPKCNDKDDTHEDTVE